MPIHYARTKSFAIHRKSVLSYIRLLCRAFSRAILSRENAAWDLTRFRVYALLVNEICRDKFNLKEIFFPSYLAFVVRYWRTKDRIFPTIRYATLNIRKNEEGRRLPFEMGDDESDETKRRKCRFRHAFLRVNHSLARIHSYRLPGLYVSLRVSSNGEI